MKIKIIMLTLLLVISCSKVKNNEYQNVSNITIQLQHTIDHNIIFDENYNTFYFSSLNKQFLTYYDKQLNYKGITNKDSIIIATLNTDTYKFYYDLYKQGFINKERFIKSKVDSIEEVEKPDQAQLLVAIKFVNNKQFLILDENNNKDFSDDTVSVFDKDFRILANDSSTIKNLHLYNFKYWNKKNNEINYFNRKIVVYPSLNDPHFDYSDDEITKKSRLIMKLKDYLRGNFNYNNINYDIAIQGFINPFLTILIKPDTLNFSENSNANYNDNFAYKINDTINLSNQSFVIDSVSNALTKLFLRKIIIEPKTYGSVIGSTLENFMLKNIDGDSLNFYDISKNKTFTLLDFWGTWCKPCRALTPDLKSLELKNKRKLNLISIAYDSDIQVVKDYVIKNNMNWEQIFEKRDFKSTWPYIIKQLKITAYPTFILLNNNHKIIYRGSGDDALYAIRKIIEREN